VLAIGGLGSIAYNIVAWRTAVYGVTNQRVIGHDGLIRRRNYDTLLSSISDVKSMVSAVGRGLGYGNLTIMSTSGAAVPTRSRRCATWRPSRRRSSSRRRVPWHGQSGGRAGGRGGTGERDGCPDCPDCPDVGGVSPRRSASWRSSRDAGAITPAEFEAKKTDLLSRI
jgi:hypothetical protein